MKGKSQHNEYPDYDTKPSDSEALFLELWWMLNISPLSKLPRPFWSRDVVPDKVLSLDQIELFDHFTMCKQRINIKSNWYSRAITWNNLTVCK